MSTQYSVQAVLAGDVYEVTTVANGTFEGKILVAAATEAAAIAYGMDVFLPDLRRNFKRLAALVLPVDAVSESENRYAEAESKAEVDRSVSADSIGKE